MAHFARQAAASVSGIGRVLEGNVVIATALYVITERQNVGFTRKMHVQAPPTFAGAIRILSGERDLITNRLMKLRLEDGRSVVFSVRQGDAAQATYDIRVVQLLTKT